MSEQKKKRLAQVKEIVRTAKQKLADLKERENVVRSRSLRRRPRIFLNNRRRGRNG